MVKVYGSSAYALLAVYALMAVYALIGFDFKSQHALNQRPMLVTYKMQLSMQHSAPYRSVIRRVLVEQCNEMARQLAVCRVVDLVQHQVDEVKAGHKTGRQLDVFNNTDARIVAAPHRVRTCQHTGPSIQGGNDACLGY